MESLCISSMARPVSLSFQQIPRQQCKAVSSLVVPRVSPSLGFNFNPLRFSIKSNDKMTVKDNKGRGFSAVCYASPITARNLQLISTVSTISSVVLMLAKGTGIHKSFLVPLLALQAPATVVSWIKGDYGVWLAFVALLVRLFFFVPGRFSELELPLMAFLLIIVAPYQVMNLRGTKEGAIIGFAIAGYLGFQHFSRAGSLQKAFEQGSIVATIAVVCIFVISCLFLI